MTHSSQECVVFAISYRLSNYNVHQKSKSKRYVDSTDYYSNYIPVQNVSFYLLSCVFRKKNSNFAAVDALLRRELHSKQCNSLFLSAGIATY